MVLVSVGVVAGAGALVMLYRSKRPTIDQTGKPVGYRGRKR